MGINPALLILISGTTLTGKSNLAKFMYDYLSGGESGASKVKLISTDKVQDVMLKEDK